MIQGISYESDKTFLENRLLLNCFEKWKKKYAAE